MVSAIITTYKRDPQIVLRALDSILAQTYKDIEIIVVDDSPGDYNLRDKVKEAVFFRQEENKNIHISYIAHDKNMGACVARNTGMSFSEGEYIAYLDDDDEWLPTKLEKQMAKIIEKQVALVYCGSICINDSKGTRSIRKDTFYKGKVLKELLNKNFIASTSYPLINKECLMSIGGFDPLMQAAQDYDVWLRLAEKYEIDYVDEPLVVYHEHNDERITTNPLKRINGTERLCQKFQKYLENDRKLWWKRHLGLTRQYALAGDYKNAFSIWWKCVCKYPEMIRGNIEYFLRIIQILLFEH